MNLSTTNGKADHSEYFLKKGQVPLRLLKALTRDFYRPQTTYDLYEQIFPGEYLRPSISEDRVCQACLRLREHFKKSQLPLLLVEERGAFRLEALPKSKVHIWIFEKSKAGLKNKSRQFANPSLHKNFDLLLALNKKPDWTTLELAEALKLAPRTASRFVSQGLLAGRLVQVGKGRSAKYRVVRVT